MCKSTGKAKPFFYFCLQQTNLSVMTYTEKKSLNGKNISGSNTPLGAKSESIVYHLLSKYSKKQLIELILTHPCNVEHPQQQGLIGLKVQYNEKYKNVHSKYYPSLDEFEGVFTITRVFFAEHGVVLVNLNHGIHSYHTIAINWLKPAHENNKT